MEEMSDEIDWIPVALWSAGVTYQVLEAIREWRKKKSGAVAITDEEQRRIVADRERRKWNDERIRSGKMVDGWKLVWKIQTAAIDALQRGGWKFVDDNPFQVMLPPWPQDGKDAAVDMTVLVSIRQEKRSNRRCRCLQNRYVIRRHSLIAPTVYDDIAIVSFDASFNGGRPMYVSESVVAIGCDKERSNEIRILLIDINTKSYQFLETTSPQPGAMIRSIVKGPSNDGLSILFQVDNWPYDTTFYVADYVITPTDSVRSPIIHQTASRQLAWAPGIWRFDSMIGGKDYPPFGFAFPGVFYGMRKYNGNFTRRLLATYVVSFDRHGFHDLGVDKEWIRKFQRTPIGTRMVETQKSYENLVPPRRFIPFDLHRSHLFVEGYNRAYIHRPISPPSQSYCDAEAFCLANPGFDFALLEDMMGFNAFDGIFDGMPPIELQM